jgi:hypothetical protein
MFGEATPHEDYIVAAFSRLLSYGSHDLTVISTERDIGRVKQHEYKERQSELTDNLAAAFNQGTSLADANAILMSRYINEFLQLPTIFIPGSAALGTALDHIQYLWSRSHEYHKACTAVAAELADLGIIVSPGLVPSGDIAPFWMQCQDDRSRVPMTWADESHHRAHGTCARCTRSVEITSKSIGGLLKERHQPALVPRVVWDDLLDGFAWGHLAGCSYRGGLEHYLFAAAVANRMGLRTLPEFISHQRSMLLPCSEFEETAATLAKSENSAHLGGPHAALNLMISGKASMMHSMLWNANVNADDIARTFGSDAEVD